MADRVPLATPGRIDEIDPADRVAVAGVVNPSGNLSFQDASGGPYNLSALVGGGGIGGTTGGTDNALLRADGGGGSTAQGSVVTVSDAGNIATPGTVDGRDISDDWQSVGRSLSTGVVSGGILSIGAPNTTFSISDGFGYVVDSTTTPSSPSYTRVAWTGKTNIAVTNIATQNITFVSIDSGGNVIQQSTRWTGQQYRDRIILGVVVHVDRATVDAVNNEQSPGIHPLETTIDIMSSIGFVNVGGGNVFSPNGANMLLNKSLGYILAHGSNYDLNAKDPNVRQLAALTGLTFQYRYQNGTNGATGTTVLPNTYDVGGTPTAVAVNKWTVQRIFCFTSNNVKIQPGQAEYGSSADAKAAIGIEAFVTEPSIAGNGLLRGFLVVKQGATNLSDPLQAQFLAANKFGDVAAASSPLSVSTLQSAYNNSAVNPEILTSTTGGAVQVRRGTASDSDSVFEVQNGAGSATFTVTGAGAATASGAITGSNLSGTNTGDQTITLTGDVTGSGTGSFAATISADAVTYAKIQNVSAASRLLGRGSAAGSGDVQELTLGSNLSISGTVLSAVGLSGTNTGDQTITLTGDVTGSGTGSFAATIANDAVTFAKIQNVTADKLLGRGNGGGNGDTQEITLGTNLSMSGTTLNATSGAPSYTIISPSSIGANQNNYSPTSWSTADIVRLTGSGNFDITGFDATATTVRKLLWNVDTVDTFTIKHESASSTAANRVVCPYDQDMKLNPDGAIVIHYDATTARWRAVSDERPPPMLLSQARRTVGALIASSSFIGWDSEVYPTLAEYLSFDSAGTWTVQKACTLLIRATMTWQAATSGVGSLVIDIRKNAVTVLQEQRSSAEQATDNYTTQVIEVAADFVATDTIRLYVTNFGGSPTTVANMMIMSIIHVKG